MEKKENLTNIEKTLYDMLGIVVLMCQTLCMGLCVYRNKVILEGRDFPLSFIMEIILILFSGIIMLKEYKFMNNYILKIYSFSNRILWVLNWVFAIIMISQIIIYILY